MQQDTQALEMRDKLFEEFDTFNVLFDKPPDLEFYL